MINDKLKEEKISLQMRYAPNSICFGCGPANEKGLRINSFVDGEEVICTFKPKAHHQAFPGILNGGIIGSLLDCHSNWTAAWRIMKNLGIDHPTCTVTAEYAVQLKRPTPVDGEIHLISKVVESKNRKAVISAGLYAGDELCATCLGTFIAVKEDHPAYHRWN